MLKNRTVQCFTAVCVMCLAAVAHANLIEHGDFEDGKRQAFRNTKTGSLLKCKAYAGDPVKHAAGEVDEKDAKSKYCFQLDLSPPAEEDKVPEGWCSLAKNIPVDPTRTYRVSVRIYTPDKLRVTVGGYARDSRNRQLHNAKGHVWNYHIRTTGPTRKGWQTFETTVGPKDSGARSVFLEDMVAVTLTVWVRGSKEMQSGTVHLDDLVFEEIELKKKEAKADAKAAK